MNQPNILFITTDQQRYDTLGPHKPAFLRTPHLDQLEREGVSFDRAYADCPVCVPARMAIMSGQQVFRHGMYNNGPSSQVLNRDSTLPSQLRAAGYQTAAIGKMHFSPQRMRHGFDEMILPDDYYREMERSGSALHPMRHGLGQNEYYPSLATVPEAQTLTSWTAEKCVSYLRDRRDPSLPFFLWCSFSKPHPPIDPPEPYYSMYQNAAIPEPASSDWEKSDQCPAVFRRTREKNSYDLISKEVLRDARSAYFGQITQIDYVIGRILAALGEAGLANDTLIMFTSDHGEFIGDYHICQKSFFHEASARVPMVMRLPTNWTQRHCGNRSNALVTHADILPTFLAAAGAETNAPTDGLDMLPLLNGEGPSRTEICGMCGQYEQAWWYGITDVHWKYIYYPEGGNEQLFDLINDPLECHDLGQVPEHAERRHILKQRLLDNIASYPNCATPECNLQPRPVKEETEQERRSQGFPGYFTEYAPIDVRH